MKIKHILILFIVGICVEYIGSLFKIMHWAHGDTLLILATSTKVASGILLIRKLITHPQAKDFLNW